MSNDAGQAGWRRAIEARLSGLAQPSLGVNQAVRIWITALAVVILACAAFFITLYWLFG